MAAHAPEGSAPAALADYLTRFSGPGRRRVHLRVISGDDSSVATAADAKPRRETISVKAMRRQAKTSQWLLRAVGLDEAQAIDPALFTDRPKTRADCENGPRPCPYSSCKHHLLLDVSDNGSVKFNFPGLDFDEIPETCALDVADRVRESARSTDDPDATLQEVARCMNLVRERVRQIEGKALAKIRLKHGIELRELIGGSGDESSGASGSGGSDDEWDALYGEIERTYG